MSKSAENRISLSVVDWSWLAKQDQGFSIRIPLQGRSMQPLIRRRRDFVTITPVLRPLLDGDIILFRRTDAIYVVHRIWKQEENRIQTFGDNCAAPDAWIDREAVLGLVVRVERGKRRIDVDNSRARSCGLWWLKMAPARNTVKKVGHKMKRMLRRRIAGKSQ